MTGLMFADYPIFWFQTQRAFGSASYGAADFGEVWTTAQRIRSGDFDSWRTAWSQTAQRIEEQGRESLAAGHTVSGRDQLMRAMTYWRSAEFFTRDRTPHFDGRPLYQRSRACFTDAIAHFDPSIVPVEILYENTTLNGYLYSSAKPGPQPTVLVHTGFDGTAEEMWIDAAASAQAHGYTVLTFDGPGQPGPRYRDGLVFRPDWEAVISPVVDFAVEQPGVDPDRIGLIGNSMGGYLAPRAAAFEPRITALLAIDGVYNFGEAFAAMMIGNNYQTVMANGDDEINRVAEDRMTTHSFSAWTARNGMWCFGVQTPAALAHELLKYHLGDGVAERIRCPTFVGRAESDEFFAGQPELLMQHLTAPATVCDFTDAEGAGSHCQSGAKRILNEREFNWLDTVFTIANR